jgi:hypothetical protein
MSDDVTWVTTDTPEDLLPSNIWFPGRTCAETYKDWLASGEVCCGHAFTPVLSRIIQKCGTSY